MVGALRRLTLVRHGETDWNRERRLQGLTDSELNDAGRLQARALAERLRGTSFDALYTSPLVRASETAAILGDVLELAPVRVPALRERDVGAWGGLTNDDARHRFPDEWRRIAAGEDVALGGGETKAQVTARMAETLDRIGARHPSGSVLVVSHGLALKLLVCRLIGIDVRDCERLATGANTSMTVFDIRDGAPRLAVYADAGHLDGVTLPR